jgi:hypothetical protein
MVVPVGLMAVNETAGRSICRKIHNAGGTVPGSDRSNADQGILVEVENCAMSVVES